ncbi:MAG: hypothetical protein HQL96_04170, partial [Magnetococcales bacterium]|nr:hypothetical protein [Magnetococcales bacterium]
RGMHTNDELALTEGQKAMFQRNSVPEIFPEYYLIKVNRFNDIARDTLDEWIFFLKNEEIRDEFTARGLARAKEQLTILKLPETERQAYESYKEDLHYQASMVESTYGMGKLEGRLEGREEGKLEGRLAGREEGRLEGRREGMADALLHLLQLRFGPVPEPIRARVTAAAAAELSAWTGRLFQAGSLDDLFP